MNKRKEKELLEAGKFAFLNENYEEAIGFFRKILESDPRNAEAYYNLGVVFEAKNMLKEAKEAFNKSLEINPEYKLAEQHLAKLVGE
ncbi:MAG: hypothetical protein DRP75_02450 [Candidatus Omnitrophota bacterium]|nr:MAG: hypothetical protein DRP75_02450 [Candidatus Omnitrophota bacterium]